MSATLEQMQAEYLGATLEDFEMESRVAPLDSITRKKLRKVLPK